MSGIKQHLGHKSTEVVFIGCQKDLKQIYLYDHKANLVVQQAHRIFDRMGVQYYEICAFTQENLKSTFNSIFYNYYNKVMDIPLVVAEQPEDKVGEKDKREE